MVGLVANGFMLSVCIPSNSATEKATVTWTEITMTMRKAFT